MHIWAMVILFNYYLSVYSSAQRNPAMVRALRFLANEDRTCRAVTLTYDTLAIDVQLIVDGYPPKFCSKEEYSN